MRGLYLITNDDALPILMEKLTAALATGKVALLQYRRKKIPLITQVEEIQHILALCQRYRVDLIINDHLALAAQFGVGVHLGQDDGDIAYARQLLGEHAIIGRTCLNSLALAHQAVADGASYIAFGAIYPSTSKPMVKNIGLDTLLQAKNDPVIEQTPICAIGGLTVENAKVVIDAGASLCAVISDVLDLTVDDIPQRVEAWAALF